MTPERKGWIAGVVFGGVVLIFLFWGLETAMRRETTGGGRFPDESHGSRSIDLVFPDEDDGFTVETREVLGAEFLEDEVRRTVEELIRGSTDGVHPLPESTRVLDVFFDGDGEIVLNLSDELRKDHPGGSEAETATLRCLAGTLAANFPVVQRLRILIDGEAPVTLAGHIDLAGAIEVEEYR